MCVHCIAPQCTGKGICGILMIYQTKQRYTAAKYLQFTIESHQWALSVRCGLAVGEKERRRGRHLITDSFLCGIAITLSNFLCNRALVCLYISLFACFGWTKPDLCAAAAIVIQSNQMSASRNGPLCVCALMLGILYFGVCVLSRHCTHCTLCWAPNSLSII